MQILRYNPLSDKELAAQLETDFPDLLPALHFVQRGEQIRLHQGKLVHPRMSRHGDEQSAVWSDRNWLRNCRYLRPDSRGPVNYRLSLLDPLGEAAARQETGQRFRYRNWLPPLLVQAADSVTMPLRIRRRSS